jgi:hypothetical protein
MTKLWRDSAGQYFYVDVGVWVRAFTDQDKDPVLPIEPVTLSEMDRLRPFLGGRRRPGLPASSDAVEPRVTPAVHNDDEPSVGGA